MVAMTHMEGQCLCGAVRYVSKTQPIAVVVCHCINCRRQSGSAFSVNALVPEDGYSQTGETRIFIDEGESGMAVSRHFCGTCGTPVLTRAAAMPGFMAIKVGTLNNPENVMPAQEIYCRSALPWLPELLPGARAEGAPALAG